MSSIQSDQKFLAKVVELYNLVHIDDAVLLINMENIILYAGNKVEEIVATSVDKLIGKNHFDVLPLPQENLIPIKASLQKVIQSKQYGEFLSINLNHHSDYLILHCIEKPIINPSTQNIVAISIESKKLDFQVYLYKLLMFLQKHTLIPGKLKHQDKLLTLREHEIAFLLFYCKTAKKIAMILSQIYDRSISAKTIANIISTQLYTKLNVYGIEALIDKLHALGYHTKLPVSFITNMHLDLNY